MDVLTTAIDAWQGAENYYSNSSFYHILSFFSKGTVKSGDGHHQQQCPYSHQVVIHKMIPSAAKAYGDVSVNNKYIVNGMFCLFLNFMPDIDNNLSQGSFFKEFMNDYNLKVKSTRS